MFTTNYVLHLNHEKNAAVWWQSSRAQSWHKRDTVLQAGGDTTNAFQSPSVTESKQTFFLLCKATHYSSFEGTRFANFIRGQRKGHIEKDCFGEDSAKGRKIFREKEKKKAL